MDQNFEIAKGCTANKPRRASIRDYRVMAHISPLPPPEEVFLDWLMAVPAKDDLQLAAQAEIDRIDRRGLRHPDLDRLRMMLLAFAQAPIRASAKAGC
jgi:hypothetical protein